ncbi:hypothetical protein EDF22_1754 [Rathayibacter sp. PhB127]|uniref:hypothetical protein n=1 Tax=Rathayibacter sp. PhB127 TaxID=2485176 RepID=UPI000F4B3BDC|nr:hypothetical protein [Rathayibacter sp. PhB127]ROS29998.1 hypothetical protein EDF22_1754 [Rathayibacter sp. PhB127]
MAELTTSELAARLEISRRHATDLVASGAIGGRRLSTGVWLAHSDSVVRYEARARRGKGRKMDPATAWGLLWELSGLRATWLQPSTRSRVGARIREMAPDEIARAVADRTRAYSFTAANPAKAAAGLIATGRAVGSVLDVGLMDDARQVSGYTRQGSVEDYARKSFLVASPSGGDTIYANTLPFDYDGDVMPVAVIAADLAVGTDTRERSGGLRALAELRREWQARH